MKRLVLAAATIVAVAASLSVAAAAGGRLCGCQAPSGLFITPTWLVFRSMYAPPVPMSRPYVDPLGCCSPLRPCQRWPK